MSPFSRAPSRLFTILPHLLLARQPDCRKSRERELECRSSDRTGPSRSPSPTPQSNQDESRQPEAPLHFRVPNRFGNSCGAVINLLDSVQSARRINSLPSSPCNHVKGKSATHLSSPLCPASMAEGRLNGSAEFHSGNGDSSP